MSPVTLRHRSVLAKLVTTADHISGGRVELGLGAGWHLGEHTTYGFEYYDTKTRMDLLEEQLHIVAGTWSRRAYLFEGAYYRLSGLDAQPRPVQQPHPPVIMGGDGGPRAARLAAGERSTSTTSASESQMRSVSAQLGSERHASGQGVNRRSQ